MVSRIAIFQEGFSAICEAYFVFMISPRLAFAVVFPDRRNREPSSRGAFKSGLTSADSGLQLIWRSRKAVSQRRSSPYGLFSRAEDALKNRVTESASF